MSKAEAKVPNTFTALYLAALGVVYGDIGTSPLYAFRECFLGSHGLDISPGHVLGVLSLIIWSLMIVISVKYLGFILRADNHGEGGVLALLALTGLSQKVANMSRTFASVRHKGLWLSGLFAAALLYGDGIITPAISVMGAVEGLSTIAPGLDHYILPISTVILIILFAVQKFGTHGVGRFFGPIIAIWFLSIALLGLRQIIITPSILAALSPTYAISWMWHEPKSAFAVLASVFLAVTGGEALYADMGHFGKRPIRIMWYTAVLPALLLNYLGQGALVLRMMKSGQAVSEDFNPFYALAPEQFLIPLVVIATAAAAIASQAVISGAFSLTRQAINLGFLPRLSVIHTSRREIGQIYVPAVNWILMFATLLLVFLFENSSSLAGAYGIAVSMTMVITTVLATYVAIRQWKWPTLWVLVVSVLFFLVDLAFLGSNLLKVFHGGFVPLLVAGGIFTVMTTWKRGRRILFDRLQETSVPLKDWRQMAEQAKYTIDGMAVFMSGNSDTCPPAFLKNLRHNHVIHKEVIILTVVTAEQPFVALSQRLKVEKIENHVHKASLSFGYMDDPDVPNALTALPRYGIRFSLQEATFFLGRETLFATKREGMALWRESLFAWLSRNSRGATSYFQIPPQNVIEIGTQVEL